MVPDDFYHAFEDKFRGSREDIKRRQTIYLPLVDAVLKQLDKPGLDVGCGRAEWLELLTQRGLSVKGVDMNVEFVDLGKSLNLDIAEGEANAYLEAQAESSLSFISAFHVVEHLSFDVLLRFLANAQRALDDHGFLLLETPNPANLTVGGNTFYMDPTHERPLPPALLSFAAEYAGFEDAIVVPVNRNLVNNRLLSLSRGVPGASAVNRLVEHMNETLMSAPDYAVIAFKKRDEAFARIAKGLVADPSLPVAPDVPFDVPVLLNRVELGLKNAGIAHLAAENVDQAVKQMAEVVGRLHDRTSTLGPLQEHAAWLAEQVAQLSQARTEHDGQIAHLLGEMANWRSVADTLISHADHLERDYKSVRVHLLDVTALADQRAAEIEQIRASSSWRVTAPLRAVAEFRSGRLGAKSLIRAMARPFAMRVARSIEARPKLKNHMSVALWKYPRLRARLAHLVGRAAIASTPSDAALTVETEDRLGKRGRDILLDLRSSHMNRADAARTGHGTPK